MKSIRKTIFRTSLGLLLTLSSTAFASDFYVSQTGSDTTGDGSLAHPYLTIQYAVNTVPDGTASNNTVIHIGAGQYAETSDGTDGQLLISNKSYLTLTGAGGTLNGGTQITTQGYVKDANNFGVLRVSNSSHILVANMVIGDDRNWNKTDAFFSSTVAVAGTSDLTIRASEILGPSQATLVAGGQSRAPTAVVAEGDASVLNLNNVLVNGHGSFLSNPRGEVHSQNVTIANLYGLGYDDHIMFLQEPDNRINDRLYTFADTIIYNNGGTANVHNAFSIANDGGPNGGGVDNVYFDASTNGIYDNLVVNGLFSPYTNPPTYYTNSLLGNTDALEHNSSGLLFSHGVFSSDDPTMSLTGNLLVNNGVTFGSQNGFDMVSSVNNGYQGGFFTVANVPEPSSIAFAAALVVCGANFLARKRRRP